jgi:hypothetical protein
VFSFGTNGNNEIVDQTAAESFVLHNKNSNSVTSNSSLAHNSTIVSNNQTSNNTKSESTPISSNNNSNNNGITFLFDSY